MTTDNSTFICCSCEYQLNENQLNTPCPECGFINTIQLKLGKPAAILAKGALRAAVGFPTLVLAVFVIEISNIGWRSPHPFHLGILLALFLVPACAAWAWGMGVYVVCTPYQETVREKKVAKSWIPRFWARVHRVGAPHVARVARYSQIGWLIFFVVWYVGEFLGPLTLSPAAPRFLYTLVNFMYQFNQGHTYLLHAFLFLCYLPVMYLMSTFCEKINHERLSDRFLAGVAVAPFCVWMLAISIYLWIVYHSLIDESALAMLFLHWVSAAITVISFLYLCAPWWGLYFALRKLGEGNCVAFIGSVPDNEKQVHDPLYASAYETHNLHPPKVDAP